MTIRSKKFRQIPPDWDLWQKLYYKYPQAYLRQRLLAIKYLWEGKTRPEVTQLLGCNYKSLTKWIDKFLEGGLQKLTEPITHQVPSRLKPEQQIELKKMLLEQKPTDYGIDRYIWTGKIISQVIHSRWGVTLKDTRIYEILEQLNLSHQKAHRDYANADKGLQQQFVETLKKTTSQAGKGKNSFFLTNLPSMTVPVYSMLGQKRIAAPKSPVMNDDAIKLTVYLLSIWRQEKNI